MKPFLAVTVLTVALCPCVFPQWSTNSDSNTAVCTAAGGQLAPTITSDGAAGAIITWADFRATGVDIYAQRMSALGFPQWTPDGVVISTAGLNPAGTEPQGVDGVPVLVSDGAGGAIIAWFDIRTRTGDYNIYAQRINAGGDVQWMPDGVVICTAASHQEFPAILADGAGGAIITWQDSRSGTNAEIFAQRVDASGVVQWTTDGVPLSNGAEARHPSIVGDGSGGAIVAWYDYRSGSSFDVYAQRVNGAGAVQWNPGGVPVAAETNDQVFPVLASDDAGGAIITWQDSRGAPAGDDIYAQRVNASGAAQWASNGVPICTKPNGQITPAIVRDESGGAIISWRDDRVGVDQDIYAQRINSSGVLQWDTNAVAICVAPDGQFLPDMVSDESGGAIMTWYDFRGPTSDIYAQRINGAGFVLWDSNGVQISTAPGGQTESRIVGDGDGGAIIAWPDFRSGNADIYAQQVSALGTIGQITGVGDQESLPASLRLHQNYPNPFNPSTTLSYDLPAGSPVTVTVYNSIGEAVVELVNETQLPGRYSATWDGRNSRGQRVASGVYFYHLRAAGFVRSGKMVLLK